MADKKKTTNKSQMVAPPARSDSKEKKTAVQSETVAPAARAGEKEQSKVVKAAASERSERKAQETKVVRRDNRSSSSSKSPSTLARLRTNRYIRFILDAYYELRHKVTWPSFNEARNMTIVVILLSAAVAAILGAADLGLYQLFLLISHIGGVK